MAGRCRYCSRYTAGSANVCWWMEKLLDTYQVTRECARDALPHPLSSIFLLTSLSRN